MIKTSVGNITPTSANFGKREKSKSLLNIATHILAIFNCILTGVSRNTMETSPYISNPKSALYTLKLDKLNCILTGVSRNTTETSPCIRSPSLPFCRASANFGNKEKSEYLLNIHVVTHNLEKNYLYSIDWC